jgi:hypothetical protein
LIGSLLKAAAGLLIETPVAIVADVLTLGGSIVEEDTPYTALSRVYANVRAATNEASK